MNGPLGFHGFAPGNPLSPDNARLSMTTPGLLELRERVIRETESFLTRELRKLNSRPVPAPREAEEWCPAPSPLASGTTWASA